MVRATFRIRRRYILTILILFSIVSHSVHGQVLNLKEQSARAASGDTVEINKLINTAGELLDNNTDSSLQLLKIAKYRSFAKSYHKGIALSLLKMSIAYSIKNDRTNAEISLDEAKGYCLLSEEREKMSFLWRQSQFLMYKYAGQTDSALQTLENTSTMLKHTKDTLLLVSVYNNIGSILIDNQDYQAAYSYIRKALSLNQYQNGELLVSRLNLAYTHSWEGQMDSMYKWAAQAFQLAQELHLPKYERSASLLLPSS